MVSTGLLQSFFCRLRQRKAKQKMIASRNQNMRHRSATYAQGIQGRNIVLKEAMFGAVAGALGTVALDIVGYADMAIRGRPPSDAPSKLVLTLADKAGLPLSSQGVGVHDQTAQNRASGLGALLGYVNGLGVGVAYGLLRPRLGTVPMPLASIGVGLAAMVASDVPLVTLGVSNPKTWGLSGWLADIIPHLIYGLVTVSSYEMLMQASSRRAFMKRPRRWWSIILS
jgi:hypothetical protein